MPLTSTRGPGSCTPYTLNPHAPHQHKAMVNQPSCVTRDSGSSASHTRRKARRCTTMAKGSGVLMMLRALAMLDANSSRPEKRWTASGPQDRPRSFSSSSRLWQRLRGGEGGG